MKKENKNTFTLLHTILEDSGMEDYSIEAVLRNDAGDIAVYTIDDTSEYKIEKQELYIGNIENINNINEDNPCAWIAFLLEKDYEIIYCSLFFHSILWNLYKTFHKDNIHYKKGFRESQKYCLKYHINAELLETLVLSDFDDTCISEFIEIVNGHTIINRFAIDECSYLFGINEATGTFGIYDSDLNYANYKNEKVYTSYLEAFNDFQERIKKCSYDHMREFNEDYFKLYGEDELNNIIYGAGKQS